MILPFEILRNDITKMKVDAIVNTANPQPVVGAGTDARIHQVAGPELLAARRKIGPIAVGNAAVTPAFDLPARYVIHAVGPAWQGGNHAEEDLLRGCYRGALQLAVEHGCRSVAFPLISSGNYGFPKDRALQIAIEEFSAFLLEQELMIYLVVFDSAAFRLSEKLFRDVASYIDENYVTQYEVCAAETLRRPPMPLCRNRAEEAYSCEVMEMAKSLTLEEMLKQEDAGFTETLLRLIDQTGRKDSEIYKKANLSKQHFSKIRNNPNYRPTKATALALAVALELDLEATRDLIGRAGYALTNSSKCDLIVRYFIEQRKYNLIEINLALYEFDQMLLGS